MTHIVTLMNMFVFNIYSVFTICTHCDWDYVSTVIVVVIVLFTFVFFSILGNKLTSKYNLTSNKNVAKSLFSYLVPSFTIFRVFTLFILDVFGARA